MNDTDFARVSESTLGTLNRALDTVAEEHEVEILYQGGVLTLEFDDPTPSKIVISPNSTVRQIWISAQATSFKLNWDEEAGAFRFLTTGETLTALIGRLVGEQLGVGPIRL
jgi:iron donor protein CyaY